MKKKIIGLGIGIALAAAAIGVTGYAAASGTESLFSQVIGEEKAEEIALEDAGVTRQEALMGTTILEYDKGQYVYDIEFTSNGVEYDYDILASDGSIVESSNEPVSKEDQKEDAIEAAAKDISVTDKAETSDAAAADAAQAGQEGTQAGAQAGQEGTQAGAQAGQEAGQAGQKAGQAGQEAAQQGQKTVKETGQAGREAAQKASGDNSLIGVEKAKEIALADAGYEESQVIMEKARYDKADEDDPAEYEIEFIADGMEYEYSADAGAGARREKDKELDDD